MTGDLLDDLLEAGEWDDPEELTLEPVSELVFSGDRWEFVGRWGRELEAWEPILTSTLRAKLHPIEVAYFERVPVRGPLMAHAGRKMGWQPIGGWTVEDVASDALEAVLALGFEVGGSSWVKMTRRVMNNRVSKLLAAETARKTITVADYPHEDTNAPEFVTQTFSDQMLDAFDLVLTKREAEALILTYQDDLSNAQAAERMDIGEQSVRNLLTIAREKAQYSMF